MKHRFVILILLLLSFVTAACTPSSVEISPSPQDPLPSATAIAVEPSATLAPTETAVPTPVPPSVTDLGGISLDYSAIAQDASLETIPAQPLDMDIPWWKVGPEYRLISLQGYPVSNHTYTPKIFIYPAGDLKQANQEMAQAASILQALLQTRQAGDDLPFLPLQNSAQALHSQVQFVDFLNGSGIRYLTQLNQGPVSINNRELFYTFQGLSSDGEFYLAAILPVTNPELQAGPEPGDDFIQALTDDPGYYKKYISDITTLLDKLASGSFTPGLEDLDAMIRSIKLAPIEATPTPEIFIHAPIEGVLSDKTRTDLSSRLGVDFTSISVVDITPQEWPDSCLGLAPEATQECTKENVPGWRVILNAAGHTNEYRANQDGTLISYSGPVVVGAPEDCTRPATSAIYSPEDGYCFAYPVRFHRTDERGPIGIFGPAYGPGPEPLYAALTVEISALPDGQTLETAVDGFLAQLGNVPMPQTRLTMSIDGEMAIVMEVVPGMLGSRDMFLTHNGKLFHFTFWPAPAVAADTAADVEDLFQTVINSLHFVS